MTDVQGFYRASTPIDPALQQRMEQDDPPKHGTTQQRHEVKEAITELHAAAQALTYLEAGDFSYSNSQQRIRAARQRFVLASGACRLLGIDTHKELEGRGYLL